MGLFTSLPIVMPETDDVRALLRPAAPSHWALAVLAAQGQVRALDSLHDGKVLAGIGVLVMAQPRALSPQENVTLDRWVRRGGRVLLFADPLLTQESTFALGDRRAPQAVALLSPILSRWGLELQFDEEQAAGERLVDAFGGPYPVNLAGVLVRAKGKRNCQTHSGDAALYAHCQIGAGRVLVVADAALFEAGQGSAIPVRSAALERVLAILCEVPVLK